MVSSITKKKLNCFSTKLGGGMGPEYNWTIVCRIVQYSFEHLVYFTVLWVHLQM